MPIRTAVPLLASVALVVAGCGGGGNSGSVEEYCQLSTALSGADGDPSDAELDRIIEVAPGAIRADVKVVVEGLRTGSFSTEVVDSATALLDYEKANCGR